MALRTFSSLHTHSHLQSQKVLAGWLTGSLDRSLARSLDLADFFGPACAAQFPVSVCECEKKYHCCHHIIDLTVTTNKKREKKSLVRTKQIVEDRAEPQQIVATRPLYCLQHPLPIQVVCKRFFPAHIVIAIHEVDSRPFRPLPVPRQLWYTSIRDALFLLISYKRDQHHRFQHRFWLRGVQPLSSVW